MLAAHNGEVCWKTPMEPKTKKLLKTYVSKLRRRFKDFMGIEDDPFYPYRKENSYRTKFKLRDESH